MTEENKEKKTEEKKKAGRPAKSLSVTIKRSFWCKELNIMIPRGAYKSKDSKELEIIEKYL